eukprot:CAMPEP_0115717010 /NCGR_PEP_ID=MMETSP0272-20121206/76641_1 /TAXON_ID=71861 /ORGANISM="Scrippsiella trochoidea, Strain CCMP3099" /LENGTH=80 /DNA_ID=CAMNT_0003159387 /DNA_START=230 /DNA_END=469 /DNA_ORIENTATION=+
MKATVAVAHRVAVLAHDDWPLFTLRQHQQALGVCVHRADNVACRMPTIPHYERGIAVNLATFALHESGVIAIAEKVGTRL